MKKVIFVVTFTLKISSKIDSKGTWSQLRHVGMKGRTESLRVLFRDTRVH